MIVDLHAHYPMHLAPRRDARRAERLDGLVVAAANRLGNFASPRAGPRVTVSRMREGGVGVALSVLHLPLLEFGERLTRRYRRRPPYGAPPADWYLPALLRQLELVERRVAERHSEAVVARNREELEAGLAAGRLVLVHCVEGGFHLGAGPASVERGVAELARRGVAYVTLAHLVWRHVATNAPSFPFLSPRAYDRLFPQPPVGLSALGRAAVEAMVAHGVLVDVTHMSPRALDDTFALLDALDPHRRVPVVASHAAVRLGAEAYNLDAATIERIAARDGVIGLILSGHYAGDGVARAGSSAGSLEVLARHVERIHAVAGSHRHTAIGTDLDGFIRPLPGLADARDLRRLEAWLVERYGAAGRSIASGNALRLLRGAWGAVP